MSLRKYLTSPLAHNLRIDEFWGNAGFPSLLLPLIVQDLGQSH